MISVDREHSAAPTISKQNLTTFEWSLYAALIIASLRLVARFPEQNFTCFDNHKTI